MVGTLSGETAARVRSDTGPLGIPGGLCGANLGEGTRRPSYVVVLRSKRPQTILRSTCLRVVAALCM